ncbi:MAG: thermonuclease family protein [Planctomycetaceae bacterium]|jgi:micrococcal nuclease|nr:thermonuclease family protein [Planctomycetaceae bacterium]
MSRKKTQKIKPLKIPNRYLISLAICVLLAVLELIHPQWRSTAEGILGALNSSATSSAAQPAKQSPLKAGLRQVVHVVDGDTLDVVDETQTKYRIRLIGANTPETVKPNAPLEPFGPEASAFTKKMIAASHNRVRIVYDGDQIDKYGRTLAFVYLQLPRGEVCLNELLVREGLAYAQLQYHFSKKAKQRLWQAQNEAKQTRKNLWSKRQ